MSASSPEAKAALRARMRAARAAIPIEVRLQLADRVEERLFGLPETARASTVLLFYSFGSEIPTSAMAERFLASGSRLLLPYLRDGTMDAAEVPPGASLVHTGYGPKEPRSPVSVDPAEVDLVVAPGLAFDRSGGRLGYGGGHYDRYLARLGHGTRRIGIGFHVQLVDRVPVEPGDEPVDVVVTDAETVNLRNG